MRPHSQSILIAVAIAAGVPVIGRVTGDPARWWVLTLLGVVLAACLWLMLFAGESGRSSTDTATVAPRMFALAGAAGLVLGPLLLGAVTGERMYWVAGFMVVGLFAPSLKPVREHVRA